MAQHNSSINDDDDVNVESKLLQPTHQPKQYGAVEDDQTTVKSRKLNRRYVSIAVMLFTMLVGSINFSIIFGSVWPYFRQVDASATTDFLGYIVAACSFGQLLTAPMFGMWSNHRPVIEPTIVSLIITIFGSILYTYAEAVSDGKWMLLFSRLIIGLGTGNLAIARSYLSAASYEKERNTVMSLLSATQGLGFILGPSFGLMFQPLGNEGLRWHAIRLHLNLYTGPGFLSALLCVTNIVLLVVFFREYDVHGTKRRIYLKQLYKCCTSKMSAVKSSKMKRFDVSSNAFDDSVALNPTASLEKYDTITAWACIVLFFLILVVFAVLETLLAPVGQDEYGWTDSKAAFNVNLISTINSIIAIVAFLGTRVIIKWIPERLVFLGGLIITILGFVIWLPYAGHPVIGGVHNSTVTDSFYEDFLVGSNHTIVKPGCNPAKQRWCLRQSKVYFFQYLIGLPIITIGYCCSSLLCYTMFSKILGPWPQGLMMGFISVSGSSGRAIGPLVLARVYHEAGPLATFLMCIGIISIAVIILLVFFKRLIPYSQHIKKQYVRLSVNADDSKDQGTT